MALALTDCKIYIAGFDLSGQMNQAALDEAVEMLDETTFGATTRVNTGGLRMVNAAAEGLWDSSSTSAPDPVLFSRVGTADLPVVMVPQGATDGNVAFLFRCIEAEYNVGGEIGQLKPFDVKMMGSGGQPLVRGLLVHPPTARTSSGDGTGRELGAVSATQKVYAAIHVLAVSGTNPTLDVIVESDSDNTFASDTTRITFAQKTGVSSEWATANGAITDTWWKISYTIGGTNSPSFTFVVALGIR